jgi:hypothetical protein
LKSIQINPARFGSTPLQTSNQRIHHYDDLRAATQTCNRTTGS